MLAPAIPILQIGTDVRLLRVCSDLIREVSGASSEWSGLKFETGFDLAPYPVILLQLDSIVEESEAGDRLDQVRRVRHESPLARLIVLTSRPTVREAVEFMRLGGHDYLELPLEAETLKKALFSALSAAAGSVGRPDLAALSLAYVDEHTGLPNARHLSVILDSEIEKLRSSLATDTSSARFAVLFMDIDHFKAVNDRHGHRVGNEALRAVGGFIRQQLREGDRLFRYAGDEFVAVIAKADSASAAGVAERLGGAVAAHEFRVPGEKGDPIPLRISVSIGIALCPDDACTRGEILEIADRALYGSKRPVRLGLSVEVDRRGASSENPAQFLN